LAQHDWALDEPTEPPEQSSSAEDLAIRPLQPLLDEFKREYCRKLLAQHSTMAAAAKAAGFTPRGLQLLLKRLGLRKDE
jgi:transcriptional regulator with GAF, ATPase, and Fis domain